MSHVPEMPIIWTEIPVRDLTAAIAFYEKVFGWRMERRTMGPNETALIPAADPEAAGAGHLYPGEPAGSGGPTIHLALPGPLEAAVARCREAGGTVLDMPPVALPEGRFAYAADPDGNSLGLFEPAT